MLMRELVSVVPQAAVTTGALVTSAVSGHSRARDHQALSHGVFLFKA
jgi:hypothetical protein